MATKTKKPTAKKAKPVKAAKPRKVTLLDTELNPLKEADSILTDVEKAEAECERRALRVELAKDDYTSARVAYKDAVVELRKLCRVRKEKHPLFDTKPEPKIQAGKATVNLDVTLPTVTITAGTESHGIPIGAILQIVEVKPGGLIVESPAHNPTAVADGEYEAGEEASDRIEEARECKFEGPDAWREFVAGKQAYFTKKESTEPQGWQALPLDAARINGRGGKLLTEAGYETLGSVAKLMRDHGQWWNKEVKGIGEETAAEIADRFAGFWAEHPEYCQQQAVA
jgi:hypothetical protein